MFDIGWSELLLIAIVALIVVGPKDLPGLFRTVGQYMGKARGMAREFQRSMEQAADESGLKEASDSLRGLNVRSPARSVRTFAEKAVGDPFAEAGGGKPAPGKAGAGKATADKPGGPAAGTTAAAGAAATGVESAPAAARPAEAGTPPPVQQPDPPAPAPAGGGTPSGS